MKHICIRLLGVLFLVLQSCCNNEKGNDNIYDDLDLMNNEFLGEWYAVEGIIPFSATLVIDSNYTYTYEGGGCLMYLGSEGIWACNGDTLLLNSYEPEECFYLQEFDEICMEFEINDSSTYRKIRTTKEGCTPEKYWYQYVIFKNVKFLIIDSVLTHIPLCPDVRDDFTRTKPVYD